MRDLFEKNTFWELETERATAEQTPAGIWRVTLDVRARKVVVDEAGVETEVPMDDWIEVGVFAVPEKGETSDQALYMEKHRIRSGRQSLTVIVPRPAYAEGSGAVSPKLREGGKPTRAGIDPRHLLSDLGEIDNNIKAVKTGS